MIQPNTKKPSVSSVLYATVIGFCLSVSAVGAQQHKVSTKDIPWKTYMAGHDMVWNRITDDYYAGAIMGNGLLGTNFYKSGENAYRLNIGRVDITEGRGEMPDDIYPKTSILYDEARLPVGYFTLTPHGAVEAENMRLSLYDAVTAGHIRTAKGAIDFTTYVHAQKNYILFETKAQGDEKDYTWTWIPLQAISPRLNTGSKGDAKESYTANPNPEVTVKKEGNYHLSIQKLFSGKVYVVAWREIKSGDKRRFVITVSQEKDSLQAVTTAKKTIDECLATRKNALENSHKDWWHAYYPASFVSFGDSKMESFYWAQQYKFACATRKDKYIVDLQGPWPRENTPWPAVWLNLNIQLTYSWQNTANRPELTEPLWNSLNDNLQNLIDNVHEPAWQTDAAVLGRASSYNLKRRLDPELALVNQYETGNLTWILFYYLQYCSCNNKTDELLNRFYPLLKRSIAYYSHLRIKEADGKYHLPLTASPEYKPAEDCNYDLSLLRWGLNTLLSVNEKYQLNEPLKAHWQDFLENLTPYPEDTEQGFMIGRDVKLESSHRHYSHLLMIYPLYSVNWEQTDQQETIRKSIAHWMSMPAYLQGYSYTGSAAMYASMGDGEKAFVQLQTLINKYIQPNTLYRESGPVIETPLAAVASLQDLYLQSWGDKIRIFPAVPEAWQESSFINFRTEGAFLVSATRYAGKTVFIQIESEADGLCRLQTGMDTGEIDVRNLSGKTVAYEVKDTAKGLIEIETHAGDIFQISCKAQPAVYPAPVRRSEEAVNPFGIR
ncbi:MAG: alpha-L-fucosidase [Dysgonamonadaceae bacterium]|jgi:hypothetical protein|nr:alpha-L-fucosidase [Dysgonamonadaceae bacterium]